MFDFSNRRQAFQLKASLYFRAAAEGRRPEMIGKLNEISKRVSGNFEDNFIEIRNIREDESKQVSPLVRVSNAMTYWGLKSEGMEQPGGGRKSFFAPAHATPQ